MISVLKSLLSPMQTLANQPRALYLLFFVQMWESFSFYGLRAILVLYMVSELKFSDAKAFGIYAIYTALSECLGVFGGRVSDKIMGLKNSIYVGGIIIALGHVLISIYDHEFFLYLGLALIAYGTGFFRTNSTALLGEFYLENDPRRDAGYTLFYVGLNIGAFLATIGCAYVAEHYGWHLAFSLAAIGMILGLIALFYFKNILERRGKKPANISKRTLSLTYLCILAIAPLFTVFIYYYEESTYILTAAIILMLLNVYLQARNHPERDRLNIYLILIAVIFLGIFYGFEEQVGTTLILFAERFGSGFLLDFEVPAATLTSVNPIVVLLLGPLVAVGFEKYEAYIKKGINVFSKIAVACFLQASAFAILKLYDIGGINQVPSSIIAASFGIIAFSELFIGPALNSFCSERAPKDMKGVMMGVVMLGYAFANIMNGELSKMMAIDESRGGIEIYMEGFTHITFWCVVLGILSIASKVITKKYLKYEQS